MYHGQGIFTWDNGNKFVGTFKKDRKLNGILYNKNNKVIEIWENGKVK